MATGDIKTFTIEYENELTVQIHVEDNGDGTVKVTFELLKGFLDLNALYWSDGDGIAEFAGFTKKDSSLNMNGTDVDWDGAEKLSSPGLGKDLPETYLTEAGQTYVIESLDLGATGFDDLEIIGLRATSTSTSEGSIKGVADEYEFTPGQVENQPPTDIRLTIDAAIAAAVAGLAPPAAANQPANTTTGVAGEGGMLIGVLSAVDPDAGDTHTFEIVGGNPGDRFVIDGDQLKLAEGKEIKEGDGSFQLTVKATDSAGNEYHETFNFVAGTSANESVAGTNMDGAGTLAEPVVGDDIIFGFRGNDGLNADGVSLVGTSGDDALLGGRGNDSLHGGEGDDQLFGGAQNDDLYGGPGADLMSGGDGNDAFYWRAGDMAGTNDDHPDGLFDAITDWGTGSNTLNLSGLLADFGFVSGTDLIGQWVQVSNDGTDTVVAVATSAADAGAGSYTNLVTLLGQTFDSVSDVTIIA